MRRFLLPEPALAAALALAMPLPQAQAEGLMVATCSGGFVRIDLPGQSPHDDHGCCRKACHAGLDRKKRDSKGVCCGA